jgi:glutamine amidotransferase
VIAIVKYNAGNIRSVQNALEREGVESIITDNPEILRSAEKVIFPGVGEAGSAMKYLRDRKLDRVIISLAQPVLGICLGLQLMCRYSEEGNTKCLGIFDADVWRFPPEDKVPHMGWNDFTGVSGILFNGIKPEDNVYYVHSYYAEISDFTVATCRYILPFSSAMKKANFYATQFHPEKSASIGAHILKNFLSI